MTDVNIGDIYEVAVTFEDRPHRTKVRPAMIINYEEDYVAIIEITSQGPKKPPKFFDQFRLPIVKWGEANLDKPSYFRVNKVQDVAYEALYKYIGTAHVEDIKTAYDGVVRAQMILSHK